MKKEVFALKLQKKIIPNTHVHHIKKAHKLSFKSSSQNDIITFYWCYYYTIQLNCAGKEEERNLLN